MDTSQVPSCISEKEQGNYEVQNELSLICPSSVYDISLGRRSRNRCAVLPALQDRNA